MAASGTWRYDGRKLTEWAMILLADDNAETRKHLALLLTNDRYGVVQAADGREALNYLQAATERMHPMPALLITDLNMPNMDGMQLIAEMARSEVLALLPIIEISGTSPASLHMVGLTAPMRRGLPGGQIDKRPGRAGGGRGVVRQADLRRKSDGVSRAGGATRSPSRAVTDPAGLPALLDGHLHDCEAKHLETVAVHERTPDARETAWRGDVEVFAPVEGVRLERGDDGHQAPVLRGCEESGEDERFAERRAPPNPATTARSRLSATPPTRGRTPTPLSSTSCGR